MVNQAQHGIVKEKSIQIHKTHVIKVINISHVFPKSIKCSSLISLSTAMELTTGGGGASNRKIKNATTL